MSAYTSSVEDSFLSGSWSRAHTMDDGNPSDMEIPNRDPEPDRDLKYVVGMDQEYDDAYSETSNDTVCSNMSLAENQPAMKAVKYDNEKLHLRCQWSDCGDETQFLNQFTEHVLDHTTIPNFEFFQGNDNKLIPFIVCRWGNCTYRAEDLSSFLRHIHLHVFHTKLKSLGENSIQRMEQPLKCQGDPSMSSVVPLPDSDFRCAWDDCSITFVSIQEYYEHVRYHCMENPKGKAVPGGVKCKWKGCTGSYPNVTKLRDHVKCHTQEKLTACPTCGSMFATRTRLIDHCYRQKLEQYFQCDLCLKRFASPRLLRDHIRSHVNNYRCSKCDMSCISPSALLSHMTYRHNQDGSDPCPYCSYSAKTRHDLMRHIRVHEQPLMSCSKEGCQFKSRSEQVLLNHQLKKHLNPRPTKGCYRCHLCDCRYSRGNSLTKHLINIHSLQWPSGHVRFRYKMQADGSYSLLTVRYESEIVITGKTEEGDGDGSPKLTITQEPEQILP